jgi:hypothetical protein
MFSSALPLWLATASSPSSAGSSTGRRLRAIQARAHARPRPRSRRRGGTRRTHCHDRRSKSSVPRARQRSLRPCLAESPNRRTGGRDRRRHRTVSPIANAGTFVDRLCS